MPAATASTAAAAAAGGGGGDNGEDKQSQDSSGHDGATPTAMPQAMATGRVVNNFEQANALERSARLHHGLMNCLIVGLLDENLSSPPTDL